MTRVKLFLFTFLKLMVRLIAIDYYVWDKIIANGYLIMMMDGYMQTKLIKMKL